MKNFTKIAGVIAMVAVLALAVSCSKKAEETTASATTTADSLEGTVWQAEDETNGKLTFSETHYTVLLQRPKDTLEGVFDLYGDTIIVSWLGSEYKTEYTLAGDTITIKSDGGVYKKVK